MSPKAEFNEKMTNVDGGHSKTSEEIRTPEQPKSDFEMKYDVLSKIGNGAHASVHIVKQKNTGKLFCAKFIPYSELEDLFSAIYEYKVVKCLSHPNIIKFYEIFINIPGKQIVIICEYNEEMKPLKHFIKRQTPITEERLSILMASFFGALSYMHTKGVCHRDISIDNLLVSEVSLESPKIIDFGSAFLFKTVEKTLMDDLAYKRSFDVKRMSARVGGKQNYMAPEMLSGLSYDQEVDTYAMCRVLWECCPLIQSEEGTTAQAKKRLRGFKRGAEKRTVSIILKDNDSISNYSNHIKSLSTVNFDQGIISLNSFADEVLTDEAVSPTKVNENPPEFLESSTTSCEHKNVDSLELIQSNRSSLKLSSFASLVPEKKSRSLCEDLSKMRISSELKNFLERGLDSKKELRLTMNEALYHPWLNFGSNVRKPRAKKVYTQVVNKPKDSKMVQDNNWEFEEISDVLNKLTKVMSEYKLKVSPKLVEKGRKNQIFIQI